MLDRIAPGFQDLCRQVLPTLPSLSQEGKRLHVVSGAVPYCASRHDSELISLLPDLNLLRRFFLPHGLISTKY